MCYFYISHTHKTQHTHKTAHTYNKFFFKKNLTPNCGYLIQLSTSLKQHLCTLLNSPEKCWFGKYFEGWEASLLTGNFQNDF